ncbi:hypothetical protein GOODEAATRI_007581 [Goodea atripinnis]|uniref:Uncharacterized protein n=1 Tax=Goodea atripinnis TaxID=208336 RepID=A0ABV0PCB1_9TELE
MAPLGGFLGTSHRQESLRQAQNLLKEVCLPSGLGMARISPRLKCKAHCFVTLSLRSLFKDKSSKLFNLYCIAPTTPKQIPCMSKNVLGNKAFLILILILILKEDLNAQITQEAA